MSTNKIKKTKSRHGSSESNLDKKNPSKRSLGKKLTNPEINKGTSRMHDQSSTANLPNDVTVQTDDAPKQQTSQQNHIKKDYKVKTTHHEGNTEEVELSQVETTETTMLLSEHSVSDIKSQTKVSIGTIKGLQHGGLLKTWAEISKFNFYSDNLSDIVKTTEPSTTFKMWSVRKFESIIQSGFDIFNMHSDGEMMSELFPVHVTSIQNEDRLWGCFYIFPELYSDAYSPTVRLRKLQDIAEIVGGVLTRDMINIGLSYLRRIPLLGDYVYIKLDLASKHLSNIEVLQHYKYIVYLDLSSNILTDLFVLKNLLYLQFLNVDFNKLSSVLDYEKPQWFLTEVRYKYNQVKKIRDLTEFWSITILDLSHNNIKSISGLENLRYLRRLDLSFNHIQRFENLSHLRLLWLDLSYNNISTFEFSSHSGLWSLLHLEYLNLNENNLTSMKLFAGCTRLRELYIRNNRLGMILELAVFMRQLRRLSILDLRANPVCSTPGYLDVVLNTFPMLLNLDSVELDPVKQRLYQLDMTPDIRILATRKLNLLLYIEQLSRARVSKYVPPADTTEVPLIVLVGGEASGKGTLSRRLATECEDNIELGLNHSTCTCHHPGHFKEVTRSKFDDMLLAGEFLTYTEMNGESYGLSREEAYVNPGKVKIVCLDLISALMLKSRNRRPYFILIHSLDTVALARRQVERKLARDSYATKRFSMEFPEFERSALHIVLSGRIIITGILNEILMNLPDDKERSEFLLESQCSLLMDSDARTHTYYQRGLKLIQLLETTSATSAPNQHQASQLEPSLYSLYKESQGTEDMNPSDAINNSYDASNKRQSQAMPARPPEKSSIDHHKNSDILRSRARDGSKSSKSVTFTNVSHREVEQALTGLSIDAAPPQDKEAETKIKLMTSISAKIPTKVSKGSYDDLDLWIGFLVETGLLQASEATNEVSIINARRDDKIDDPEIILKSFDLYQKMISATDTTTIRDSYEDIHRKLPGLFWDTVNIDKPEKAYRKVKKLIKDIVNTHYKREPMFDIDFANLPYYPNVEKKLAEITKQIAPHRLFF